MDNNFKIEVLYNQRKKNMVVAYLLGAVLGGFGAHYFYCRESGYGAVILGLLLLSILSGGALAFLYWIAVLGGVVHTYYCVEKVNAQIRLECEVLVG